jgi:sterol 3beta-glucosyltransferase
VSESVYILKYAPHTWLFPHVAAVVHHGGAGTAAAALCAEVPSVSVPFYLDQPFWGQRLYELGVATAPLPRKKLTAAKLAAAITEATGSQALRTNAQSLGRKVAAEDGLSAAVQAVEKFLTH